MDEYRDKVIEFLDRMPVGPVYMIDTICRAENKEQFITIVKAYIDAMRPMYGNGIEFSADYTHLYKRDVSGLPLCIDRE